LINSDIVKSVDEILKTWKDAAAKVASTPTTGVKRVAVDNVQDAKKPKVEAPKPMAVSSQSFFKKLNEPLPKIKLSSTLRKPLDSATSTTPTSSTTSSRPSPSLSVPSGTSEIDNLSNLPSYRKSEKSELGETDKSKKKKSVRFLAGKDLEKVRIFNAEDEPIVVVFYY
jgi:predicted RNA-binding protein with RPS1 domain